MAYKRVLLKISGEQMAGVYDHGIDANFIKWLCKEVSGVVAVGVEIVVVVGGGNMVRGAQLAGNGIKRVTADQMGMLSGLMNAMALTDIFEAEGLQTRCVSNVYAEQLAESYSYRLAVKHLEQGRVLVVAGGLGRPYFTHDTAAVSIALELGCEVVMKATKVDGVYTADPNKDPSATRLPKLSFQQAVENPNVQVMDKAALGLAMEQNIPLMVLDITTDGSLLSAVQGGAAGTLIS